MDVILQRYRMVTLMSDELAKEVHANGKVADTVYALIDADTYLTNVGILPETLYTLGFMRSERNNLDYLPSANDVSCLNHSLID